jgi:hypothetical protein
MVQLHSLGHGSNALLRLLFAAHHTTIIALHGVAALLRLWSHRLQHCASATVHTRFADRLRVPKG